MLSSAPPSYVVLKDSSSQVISTAEADFIRTAAFASSTRLDGRSVRELRPCRLTLMRSDGLGGGGSATATVQWGAGTRATCACTGELAVPHPDRPSEGMVHMSVDASPCASTAYRPAAPVTTVPLFQAPSASQGNMDPDQRLLCNRILRCLERLLLSGGGALDAEALCVQPSHWVWKLTLAVTILDAGGGNVLDACVLACMAALRHYRRPHVLQPDQQQSSEFVASAPPPTLVPTDWKEPTPLPLHHTPLCVSTALIERPASATRTNAMSHGFTLSLSVAAAISGQPKVAVLVDPSAREELVQSGVVTLGMNAHGELLLLDFGGGCEIGAPQLRQCHAVASELIPTLCRQLDDSLQTADDQARAERLHRLQRQQHPQQADLPPTTSVGDDDGDDEPMRQSEQLVDAADTADDEAARRAKSQAEEAYRTQALDYNRGHAPVAIRENKEPGLARAARPPNTALLAILLQSAAPSTEAARSPEPIIGALDAPGVQVSALGNPGVNEAVAWQSPAPEPPRTVLLSSGGANASGRADSDEDDDEETLQLRSEFAMLEGSEPVALPSLQAAQTIAAPARRTVDHGNEAVDDLAAAIKKRKKKSKKK